MVWGLEGKPPKEPNSRLCCGSKSQELDVVVPLQRVSVALGSFGVWGGWGGEQGGSGFGIRA